MAEEDVFASFLSEISEIAPTNDPGNYNSISNSTSSSSSSTSNDKIDGQANLKTEKVVTVAAPGIAIIIYKVTIIYDIIFKMTFNNSVYYIKLQL